jgi:hypothetical protein
MILPASLPNQMMKQQGLTDRPSTQEAIAPHHSPKPITPKYLCQTRFYPYANQHWF